MTAIPGQPYRTTPRWIVYPLAIPPALIGLGLLSFLGRVHGLGVVIAAGLAVLSGVVLPAGLVLWYGRLGVYVRRAGIVSVGGKQACTIAWHAMDSFTVAEHPRSGGLVVFAILTDSSRVPLEPLMDRATRRERLEAFCAALEADRAANTGSVDDERSTVRASDVPLGWRGSAKEIAPPSRTRTP